MELSTEDLPNGAGEIYSKEDYLPSMVLSMEDLLEQPGTLFWDTDLVYYKNLNSIGEIYSKEDYQHSMELLTEKDYPKLKPMLKTWLN